MVDENNREEIVRAMLRAIGDDVERDGLLDTPARVVRSWGELFGGIGEDPRVHLARTFETTSSQMVSVNGVELFSTCEHHLLPFFGTCDVSYIPRSRVVGLSKVARMVDGYARRLQIQERLAEQIADAMLSIPDVVDVAVRVRARHLCMVARGVRDAGASMTTTALRGAFLSDTDAKREWLAGLPA